MFNAALQHIRTSYLSISQNLPQTWCPRLDSVFVTSLGEASEVKATDRELSKTQALVLDAVAPLTHLLSKVDGEDYTVNDAKEVRESLKLVGNASSHLICESRTWLTRVSCSIITTTIWPRFRD